jgi:hypothetical protein
MFKIVDGVDVPLTEEEIAEFEERTRVFEEEKEAYKKTEYKYKRAREYPKLDDMLVALIEKEEGRPEALNELMARRQMIKSKHPKPTQI